MILTIQVAEKLLQSLGAIEPNKQQKDRKLAYLGIYYINNIHFIIVT